MVGLRFADMRLRPTEFLDFTSLTVEEFQMLIPPFEAAFQAHMAVWCLDGTARTARRFSVYQTCPLATPEDRLFFLLTYLKTYTLQVVQGRLFGMGQSKANQWIHVLLPALLAALRDLGDAPTRSLTALARRLGVPEAVAVGLSVICVQKVPLRKVREINALRHALSANQLKYRQIQLFVGSPGFCPPNERFPDG